MNLFGAKHEIPSLDGWRAVAIAIVFVSHAGLGDIVPGGLGVSLFFFLSGFLITTLILREYAERRRIDISAFYLRRVLRIVPPMVIVAVLAYLMVAAGVLRGGASLKGLLAQILYFANYYSLYFDPGRTTPSGTGVYWSLTVEEHFYFLFPLMLLALLRAGQRRRLALWLGATCLAVLVWRMAAVSVFNASSDRVYYATDTRLDAIVYGCALSAWCWRHRQIQKPRPGWLGMLAMAAGLGLILLSLLLRDPWFRDTWRYTVQGIAFIPLFYYSVHHASWGPFRLLNLPWMKQLGVYSYVVYLVHHIAIENLRRLPLGSPVVAGVAALSVSLLAAWAMHRYVELPLRPLRARWAPTAAPSRRVAPTPVAPP